MKGLALVALAACGSAPPLSVRPVPASPGCGGPVFVDQVIEKSLSWECDLGQQGRVGSPGEGHCQQALEATARCEGVECTTAVQPARAQQVGYFGGRTIAITPRSPGPMQVFVDLQHAGGFHERYLAAACEVLPAPAVVLTCQTRDPASGEFLPCPTPVPSGWEVHLVVSASIDHGEGLPTPQVWLDGHNLDIGSTYGHEPAVCTKVPGDDPRTASVRCTAIPPPGVHRFEAQVGRLPRQELHVEVGLTR